MRRALLTILLLAVSYAVYHELRPAPARLTPPVSVVAATSSEAVVPPRMSPGIAFDSSAALRAPLPEAPPAPPEPVKVSRTRPSPITPMTRMLLGDSMELRLGDPTLPTWFRPDPGHAAAMFIGKGPHYTTTAFRKQGFMRISVGMDPSYGIRCIMVERMQPMWETNDSLTALFERPPGQVIPRPPVGEERVWWGADSRVAVWGGRLQDRSRASVAIAMIALMRGEAIDTLNGPMC